MVIFRVFKHKWRTISMRNVNLRQYCTTRKKWLAFLALSLPNCCWLKKEPCNFCAVICCEKSDRLEWSGLFRLLVTYANSKVSVAFHLKSSNKYDDRHLHDFLSSFDQFTDSFSPDVFSKQLSEPFLLSNEQLRTITSSDWEKLIICWNEIQGI